jgi:hypothetical protein
MLNNEQIVKFQALYKQQFGKEISHEEANEKGATLVRLVSLIYKPMSTTQYKKIQKRRQETGDIETNT